MTYPCYNHEPRRATWPPLAVQVGWSAGRRVMAYHQPKWADIECGHITSHNDPECEGCCWRQEENDE